MISMSAGDWRVKLTVVAGVRGMLLAREWAV